MGDMNVPARTRDDAALLARARAGDATAVATLYDAHLPAARRLALVLAGPDDADDLASDAFARVLARLRCGSGPAEDFRSYLFATMRNRHRDLLRRGHHAELASDRPWLLDEVCPAVDAGLEERDPQVAEAFASLPDRWQGVLWELVIEGRSVTDVATDLGLSPTALTSLAARARSGLRAAYLRRAVGVLDAERRWTSVSPARGVLEAVAVRDAS